MVMPALIGGFGNFLLPLMVGGPDMAKNRQVLLFSSIFGVAPKSYNTSSNGPRYDYNGPNKIFGSYLAGLFEGDGHIWIQKLIGSKAHNPRFCITFSLKNEALAKKLLEIIGSGFIRYKSKDNACVLVVSPVVGLKKIVNLINGELRTPVGGLGTPLFAMGIILSNSGNTLKLLAPSSTRKGICGWFNWLCMVIVHKMIEREIGNRGSKSVATEKVTVKEQRVYGSRGGGLYHLPLRFTLKGFERNYQVKIPSNQISKVRFYSTLKPNKTQSTLNPWFLTGFSDGEACFMINVYKSSKHIAGWGARAGFQIGLHTKDLQILNSIRDYFSVGSIFIKGDRCVYYVQSIKDLDVILNHFEKYPLITQKLADYILFKMAINLIKEKAHLNLEGLQKLISIRASLNWGLTLALEAAFPDIIPYPRPSVSDIAIKDPQWLAGFASAEGCFLIRITESATHLLGYRVFLIFKLGQHSRDEQLLRSLVDYLGCGKIYLENSAVEFRVSKFSDLTEKIIPFFQKYCIQGVKYLDYTDFVAAPPLPLE